MSDDSQQPDPTPDQDENKTAASNQTDKPIKRSRSCLVVLSGVLVWVLGVMWWPWTPLFYFGLALIATGVIIGFVDTVRDIAHTVRTIIDRIRSKPTDSEPPRSGGLFGMLAGIGILALSGYIIIIFIEIILEWIGQAIDAFMSGIF